MKYLCIIFLLLFVSCKDDVVVDSRTNIIIESIKSWGLSDINIKFSTVRTTNDPNWITSAGSDCMSTGIPLEETGENCSFLDSDIVGMCISNHDDNGVYTDTTIIIRNDAYVNYSDLTLSHLFSHEIGHCLGLNHTRDDNDVMNIFVFSPPYPNKREVKLIKDVYENGRTDGLDDNFTYWVKGVPVKHKHYPVFTIHSDIMNSNPIRTSSFGCFLTEDFCYL